MRITVAESLTERISNEIARIKSNNQQPGTIYLTEDECVEVYRSVVAYRPMDVYLTREDILKKFKDNNGSFSVLFGLPCELDTQ